MWHSDLEIGNEKQKSTGDGISELEYSDLGTSLTASFDHGCDTASVNESLGDSPSYVSIFEGLNLEV